MLQLCICRLLGPRPVTQVFGYNATSRESLIMSWGRSENFSLVTFPWSYLEYPKTMKKSYIHFSRLISSLGFLQSLFVICFSYATYFVISTSSQLPLDLHAFRQSQTALSTYWINSSPNIFSYYTPIIGAPWSIPFEFPTYQIIVSFISSMFEFPLVQTGRILSFIFFLNFYRILLSSPSSFFQNQILLIYLFFKNLFWTFYLK